VEEDDLQNRCAVHILRGCVQGVLRVLLDGGEPRVFASHDAALIQDDIDSHLKEVFLSDGDGLEDTVIEHELRPLRKVLMLMELDEPTLMGLFHGCKVKPSYNPDKPALPPYPTDGNLTTNPDVLLRVLAHRADRTISKLLKTHYNLPRGLDASEMYRAKAKLFQGMLGFSSAGAGGSGGSSSYYNPGGSNRLSPLRAEAGDKPRKSRSSFNVLSKSMGKPRWGKKGS